MGRKGGEENRGGTGRKKGMGLIKMHYMPAWNSQTIKEIIEKNLTLYIYVHIHIYIYFWIYKQCQGWLRYKATGNFIHCWRDCKFIAILGNNFTDNNYKSLTAAPAIPDLGMICKETLADHTVREHRSLFALISGKWASSCGKRVQWVTTPCLKMNKWSWWDGSVGKATCCRACHLSSVLVTSEPTGLKGDSSHPKAIL